MTVEVRGAPRLLTSTANPTVRAARRLRSGPGRGGEFLVEGPPAVGEALGRLRRLFVTPDAAAQHPALVDAAITAGVDLVLVAEPVLSAVATTVTPQGLVGVAVLDAPDLVATLRGATFAIVLAEAGDPGNAGTVVRTADAAGADAVVLTAGGVDPRNPKAVRASAGSLFHLPVVHGVTVAEVLSACRRAGLQLVATVPGAAAEYTAVDLTRPSALLFGNEARGLHPDVVAACDVAVRVPLHGRAESLNLAATVAVLGYETARQRAAATAGRR